MEQEATKGNCAQHSAVQAELVHMRQEFKSEVVNCRSELMVEIGHIKEICSRLTEENRLVAKSIGEIRERTLTTDQSSKSAHHRLDNSDVKIAKVEQERSEIIRLASSIERLAESIASHDRLIENHDARLNAIEKSAGNFLVKVAQQAVFVLVGGLVGAFVVMVIEKL